MHSMSSKAGLLFLLLCLPFALLSQNIQILTDHVGYENNLPKKAILMAGSRVTADSFQLVQTETGAVVYSGKPMFSGPVDKWKNWLFWTMDFSGYTVDGTYRLSVHVAGQPVISYPFVIGKNVLEQATISNLIYYFKGQRSSGLLDEADHHLSLEGQQGRTVDAHGGWYDATGDYGKHLSHLSFSTYFNPQQISFTVWSLLKTYQLLIRRPGTDFRQYNRRLLDEAMYGADYLTRMQAPGGSFYRSVGAPGPAKKAKDRVIAAESKGYSIKKSKDQSFAPRERSNDWRSYQASYRSGGGMAIAALALASTFDSTGEYKAADYLKAAENAFAFLEKNNASMTNDGRENIVDNYCALAAATELVRATGRAVYQEAAEKRAMELIGRLSHWGKYRDYWRADDHDRPFFHPSDAGLPVVCLLTYYPLAPPATQRRILDAVRRSLRHDLDITAEVTNPFGYARQLIQDTAANRHSAFFFPHGSEAAPWWQGENARLASLAAAARMAAGFFTQETAWQDSLENFALDQLNWVMGLNPYDACMMQGTGHNNPAYAFFGTFEYTNAPGGIVNGVTSGFDDENGIDFNLPYLKTGKDNDWRWVEQWLPHASWFLLAVALGKQP